MSEQKENLLLMLVSSLASTAWMQLGKVPNPITNKVERDLDNAKLTIDILRELKEKTKGNLTEQEDKVIISIIADLELNYVDEVKKVQN